MQQFAFSRKTFAYFDRARRNSADRAWFETHREQYAEHVEVPMTHLVLELKRELGPLLPGIDFVPRKLSKPVMRKANDADGPVLRENVTASFAQTATSMFETNAGIYVSVGAKADDNVVGCGLYMPSSRQMKLLRPACLADHARLKGILAERKLKQAWGGLSGGRFTRFPKDFDEAAPGAEYLWYKQFFLGKDLSREDVMAADFIAKTTAALRAAVPFVQWIRNTVGVYKKPRVQDPECD